MKWLILLKNEDTLPLSEWKTYMHYRRKLERFVRDGIVITITALLCSFGVHRCAQSADEFLAEQDVYIAPADQLIIDSKE